jgi:kynurenine formamidase
LRALASFVSLFALTALLACGAPERSSDDGVPDQVASLSLWSSSGRWIDLTWPFSAETIYWPTEEDGFRHDTLSFGMTDGGYFYSAYEFSGAEHGGTHIDAPIHFAEGGEAVDEVGLDHLIAPAVVVDVTESAGLDYLVSVADLEAFEADHGVIPDGAIVLLRTGWGARYGDRTSYLGTDLTGPDAVSELHFPGLSPDAARWLTEHRNVAAVGIDTPSIDYGQSATFDSHVILYSENIPGFENVANLDQLPQTGSYLIALPMKIEGGSGAPLRIVAWVPGG